MCPPEPSASLLTGPCQTQPLRRQINFNSLDHNKLIFIRKGGGREGWSPELQRFKPAVDCLLAFGLGSKYRRRGFLQNIRQPSSLGGVWGRLEVILHCGFNALPSPALNKSNREYSPSSWWGTGFCHATLWRQPSPDVRLQGLKESPHIHQALVPFSPRCSLEQNLLALRCHCSWRSMAWSWQPPEHPHPWPELCAQPGSPGGTRPWISGSWLCGTPEFLSRGDFDGSASFSWTPKAHSYFWLK